MAFDRKPPLAQFDPQIMGQAGEPDPLAWLEDANSSATQALITAEQQYESQYFDPQQPLVDNLFQEMKDRLVLDDSSYPVKIDDYYYYVRTEIDSDYAIHCRKHRTLQADEEIILDENTLSKGHDYFDVGSCVISPCHRYLAYTVDCTGDERYTLYIKDCKQGHTLIERIANLSPDIAWSKDSSTLYYLRLDQQSRPSQCFRHQLGSIAAADVCIFHEWDAKFFLSLSASKSDDFLFLISESADTNEFWFIDNRVTAQPWQLITEREHKIRYYVETHPKGFYIISNRDAVNFAIWKTDDLTKPHQDWQQLVAERDGVTIEDIEAFKDYLVVTERHHEQLKFQVFQLAPFAFSHMIEFPDAVYDIDTGDNVDENSNCLRFSYESLASPESLYDYELGNKEQTLLKQMPLRGTFDSKNYQTERLLASAEDGTAIPISLVYNKKFPPAKHRPLYLYGYGAYGSSSDVWFSASRLSLLDRGVTFAIAHVRGGGDCGEKWHLQGKLEHKNNSFTDFVACEKTLIAREYTGPEKLIISGASAGGLLVGAAANLAPELCRLVIADVPFVDTLNTMCNEQLTLTVTEYDEWGDPHDPAVYDRIKNYSPYENVADSDYPTFYVTCGMHDTRVPYWEAVKWVQKIRQLTSNKPLALLVINDEAGHAGSSGRFAAIQETAKEYAFIMVELGID